nr:hypothetical protein [Tanacetum cinerariifolium]
MWYFLIIPRLQRLFKLESISEDLRWYATRMITDGVLRHPVDSKAWRTIDEKLAEIAKDPRNLRLGISADGVDVNLGTSHHSVWLVLSVIYNLPLWLCMKRTFIMLSVLILGRQKKAFNGQQEFQLAPNPLTEEQINNEKRKTIEEEGSSNQVNEAYWKKFNIWYRKLRYWRHNYVPHCIDFVHVEKNVCKSLVRTLLSVLEKTKDGMNARLNLAELGIKLELFAWQEKDKTTLPPAGYTLTNAKKDIFCEMLSNIKVIKGHVRNRNRPEGCIAEETIAEETIEFFSEYYKTMKTIGIPPDKHVTNENEDEIPLSTGKSSEVFVKVERELAISKVKHVMLKLSHYRNDCKGIVIRKSK